MAPADNQTTNTATGIAEGRARWLTAEQVELLQSASEKSPYIHSLLFALDRCSSGREAMALMVEVLAGMARDNEHVRKIALDALNRVPPPPMIIAVPESEKARLEREYGNRG